MEQLEARPESLQGIEGDAYLATISVSTDWPYDIRNRPDKRLYTLEIDVERQTMTPKDKLQECFDVHHKFEYSYGLNPKLRRQWKTTSLIDGIVDRIFKSRLLIDWSLLPEDGESDN